MRIGYRGNRAVHGRYPRKFSGCQHRAFDMDMGIYKTGHNTGIITCFFPDNVSYPAL